MAMEKKKMKCPDYLCQATQSSPPKNHKPSNAIETQRTDFQSIRRRTGRIENPSYG
jgi:hypothetical protein